MNTITERDLTSPASPRRSDHARDVRSQSTARSLDATIDGTTPPPTGDSLLQFRANVWRPDSGSGASPPWLGIALWFGLTAAAAALGALASSQAPAFYALLGKPAWAPPAAVFGPVWGVLYLLMAWAAVIVWRWHEQQPRARLALTLYAAALIPGVLWSWTFFHWHLGGVSLAVIAVFWGLLLLTVLAFGRVRTTSALLMLPVLVWVTFAAALNARLWQLNPGLL